MTKTMNRHDTVARLRRRDGDICAMPFCDKPLDFSLETGPWSVTIDHWFPQWYGRENGWSDEKIWDLKNLRLAHKTCNAKKGERIPNKDGTLPERPQKKFRYRRDKRASRPEYCLACNNGHDLFVGEICASCGCNAKRFPMSAKVPFPDCDHEILWCWVCSITPEMRPAAVETALLQGESGEWDAE